MNSEKLIDVYIQRFEDVQSSFEENVLSFHSIETILKTKKVVERKNNYILRHIANSYVSKISLSNSTCFRQIQEAGLKLNQRSAICFALKATFLGHQVSNEVIQPNGENVKKIQELPTPKNVTEVIQILGLHYRHFVPNSAETMRPLIDLTKKNKEFIWSKSGEQAFMKLKQILSKPNILSYLLNDDGQFILHTDDCSVGAILIQVQGGREKVIAYGSITLNKLEISASWAFYP